MSDDKNKGKISDKKREMAETRVEIERTAEALKDKLEPEKLKQAAKEVVADGVEATREKALEVVDSLQPSVLKAREKAAGFFQEHPVVSVLAGLGMLALLSLSQKTNEEETDDVRAPSRTIIGD